MSDYLQKRMQQILDGRPLAKKEYKGIAKKSAKRIAKESEEKKAASVEGKEESLNQWFERIAQKHLMGGVGLCMECGSQIMPEYMRHATAHLLEKRHFKSVATNDLNYMILCAHNGCHDKTHRVDKIVTLKVWPEIKSRINQLLPLVTSDELRFISAQLYEALENY